MRVSNSTSPIRPVAAPEVRPFGADPSVMAGSTHQPEPESDPAPDDACTPYELTIAICTRDRRESLIETLESIRQQSWEGAWEVLVVDNASKEGLESVIGEFQSRFPAPLWLVHEGRPGLSHARNLALERARGRALVFIDDDVTCLPRWLSSIGNAFRDPEVTAAGGPIRPVLPLSADPWLGSVLETEVGGPSSRYEFGDDVAEIVRAGRIPAPFGANMSVLRQVALDAGGFDSRLGWGQRMVPSEETEFFRRVLSNGVRALYLPEAAVLHRIEAHRTSKEYWLRWQRGFGRALVLMNPPSNTMARVAKLVRYGWRALRSHIAARTARSRNAFDREVTALRRREQAVGRLLELAGR